MPKKLNWGIVTTGGIARKFAADLPQSQTGRLVAVGARRLADAEKFAADFGGARAHGSYEALLADPEVEAVYIGTPHPWHASWAIAAAASLIGLWASYRLDLPTGAAIVVACGLLLMLVGTFASLRASRAVDDG